MNSIVGSIPPYAGGIATVGRATVPIDAQGNFSVPVSSDVLTRTIVLTPPIGTPYAPLSLSVTGANGAHNITAQIAGALTVVGSFVGIPGTAVLAANAEGFAVPSGDGGTVTAVTGTGAISSSGGNTPAISVATATASVLGVVKPDGTTIAITAGVISLGTLPATSGAPITTPAVGTCAFDPATGKLYIYATAGWVSVTLS